MSEHEFYPGDIEAVVSGGSQPEKLPLRSFLRAKGAQTPYGISPTPIETLAIGKVATALKLAVTNGMDSFTPPPRFDHITQEMRRSGQMLRDR